MLIKGGIVYLTKNKIMVSYWKQLIVNNVAIIFIYVCFMLLLLLLMILYKVRLIIWWDLLRFSLLPVVFYFSFRVYQEHKKVKNLQQLLARGKLPPVSRHSLVEMNYIIEIQKLKTEYYQSIKKYKDQLQEHQDYLTHWSHEIKVPITDLLVLSENKEQVSSIQVHEQAVLIKQHLDLMLNYDRLADFNHDLRFNWVSLEYIVKNIIAKYSTFFINKQVHLELNISNIKILTDQKWMQALLEQIIFNAIKYSNKEGSIKINWSKDTLRIIDNGIGIASSDLPRIFEPGFTGINGRKNDTATGMGLYLADQISRKLNNKLKISSILNQGTTVNLVFPKEHYSDITKL
ncbi:hypothetical protein DS831_00090 [Bombilactobacillus bombi]|uniref:histidine kinase n=1 Tax=Bombilactobacillus bombi TaxID=1303590 RepID=A0A347SQB2_9LACO|nr:sensor histidine kinase [Bombilactobacillus bombi]RHW51775.1 hypothetical protein DS831_00090 [Bombilactobacillus bombi]